MTNRDKLWIFTFEYAGIIKVGGLGEVPANQTKYLNEIYNNTVFIPGHGQKERLEQITQVEKIPFNCIGQLDLSLLGYNEIESSYSISFYQLQLNEVKIILLCGENSFTKKYLDDPIVYNPDTFNGKMCLFSMGMRSLIEFYIDKRKEELPDIVHMHDYHVVIPFMGMKQQLYKHGMDVPSIITIHLITWPVRDINFFRACGIDNTPIKILTKDGLELMSIEEIFNSCEGKGKHELNPQPPSIEKIGAYISDLVTTVSESYLNTDVIPRLGKDLIKFKTDFIWDGCDWEYKKIYQEVLDSVSPELRKVLNKPENAEITRENLKNYLLTYKIGHINQSPLIKSEKILQAINEISNGNQFVRNGFIKAFDDTGPLMITTGRISSQKGFDVILNSIPEVIKQVPNAKFLFMILPTEYNLKEIGIYAQYVKNYPENIRIIFGVAADIFYLAHLSADVYAALSRWEPFGIMALEAMALRLPIIATKVGGLQETIIDVREVPEFGTGLLIEKDNQAQFIETLVSFFRLAEIDRSVKEKGSIYTDPRILKSINLIPDQILKSRILLDGNYFEKIRENAFNRVKYNFTWEIVSKKLVELYAKVKNKHPKS